MTSYEQYALIIQAASYLILAAGLIVAIIEVHQLRKQRISEHDWNRVIGVTVEKVKQRQNCRTIS